MAGIACATALAACTPALDWRELPVDDTGLKAMFPCKPDHETRQVRLAGRPVSMQALACRSGSSGTFAVLAADLGSPLDAARALREWRAASLARLHAGAARVSRFHPRGAQDLDESVRLVAAGMRADGSKVQSEAAYFAHGRPVFEAVVLAARLRPEATQPFFSGLRFE